MVLAVTSLGRHVYAVRHQATDVEQYDTESLQLTCRLSVPGLGPFPYGLTSLNRGGDGTASSVFVSDYTHNVVWRIDLDNDGLESSNLSTSRPGWSVGRQPTGLSTTPRLTVLVACSTSAKIKEISPIDGRILREHRLPTTTLGRPWQAAMLPDCRQMVVSSLAGRCVALLEEEGDDGGGIFVERQRFGGLKVPRSVVVADVVVGGSRVLVVDQRDNSLTSLEAAGLVDARRLPLLRTADGAACGSDESSRKAGSSGADVTLGEICGPYAACVVGRRLLFGECVSGRIVSVSNWEFL